MLQENCYIVSDETKQCVIIDCGAYYEEERKAIARYVSDNGLKPLKKYYLGYRFLTRYGRGISS